MRTWRDNTFYMVVADFPQLLGRPRVAIELDLAEMKIDDVIEHLSQNYGRAVFAFNPIEGWARDVSDDIAEEWLRRVEADPLYDSREPLPDFVETHLHRRKAA